MFNGNLSIEDRGKGWRVYLKQGTREMCVFMGWVPKTGYNPFDAQACYRGLRDCQIWVRNNEN